MTVRVLTRGFLLDYGRNPTNLVVLVLVPLVFVVLAAGALADASRFMGGDGASLQQATAGWAAGFLSAVAMYFQVSSARDADRRLLLCGLRPATLIASRLLSGSVLALVATGTALAALAVKAPFDRPGRLLAGTALFALVYLGLGAAVGAVARDAVNGCAAILLVWSLDVFLGPTMGSDDIGLTRVFPTHFVALWVAGRATDHSGPLQGLALGLVWVVAALLTAALVLTATSRVAHGRRTRRAGTGRDQYVRALVLGLRDLARNRVLWVLLVVVPAVFIWVADVATPTGATRIAVREGGRLAVDVFDPADTHAGTMTPIAVAALAMLVGLFTVLATRVADRRLCLAGMRPHALFAVRLTTVALATLVVTVVALGVTALVFSPESWPLYAAGILLASGSYALLGALVGPLFGRVSGVFLAFMVPFLDLGVSQSPMLHVEPSTWARWLPGYGPMRLALDGGLTRGFDERQGLGYALLWVLALLVVTGAVWLRAMRTARPALSG